jgi:hypothetical protein
MIIGGAAWGSFGAVIDEFSSSIQKSKRALEMAED